MAENPRPKPDPENEREDSSDTFADAARNSRKVGRRIGFILQALGPAAARIALELLDENGGDG